MGSSLFGKALACTPQLSCPSAEFFRCTRVVASAVFTAGSFSPLPGLPARSRPYLIRPLRRDWAGGPTRPSLRWAAAQLPRSLDVDSSVP